MTESPQGPVVEPPAAQAAPVAAAPEPKRPPGLTVLAVLNFVFGGLGIIALFALMLGQHILQEVTEGRALIWANYLMIFMRLVTIILAISSAIGYLGVKWLLGWVLGNAYACVAILNTVLYAVLLDEGGMMSFFWLIYPTVTLFLLNLALRKHFVRPPGRQPGAAPAVVAGIIGLVLLVAAVGALAMQHGAAREVTDLEVRIADSLRKDVDGNPLQDVYAEKISFPKLTIKRAGVKRLRLDWVVHNAGDRRVTRLEVEISLLDEDGIQVAGDTDLLAHGLPFGENNTPVPPRASKRAGGEIENPRGWKEGKVRVTIIALEAED